MANQFNLNNYNVSNVNIFIQELKKIYETFGYNNVNIEYSTKLFEDTNTADLYFNINEGKITKINRIFINGNESISAQDI